MSSQPPIFALRKPELGVWRDGNTGVAGVWRFESRRPGPRVLISALIHGNELCGAIALMTLLKAHLRPACGTLTLALCNLAAFDCFDATALDASRFVEEDLNRVWQADRLATLSTLERRRAAELLPFIKDADWLLDLHSMHEPGAPLLLTGLLERNLQLALRVGTPATVVIDAGHAEGTRLRDYEQFADINGKALALLIECGYHGDAASTTVALDMTVRFLLAAKVLDDPALFGGMLIPLPPVQTTLRVVGAVLARSGRFSFEPGIHSLQTIAVKGTVIGHDGDEPVLTPVDGCVLVMPSVRQLRPGVTVVRFATRV
jgi:Succinylglutamate desuccinylase / Aspartoacylase family